MESKNMIEIKDVCVRFRRYYDKSYSLKEKVIQRNRNKYEEVTVLNQVSFAVEKGETVGLIGSNGCGKSTILKLLTKILYPDSGTIEVRGRVSSLLELGAGFHPDLSGRENINVNASVFGLSQKEIARKMETIIRFSELGEYIDNPVRTYSTGMYMRLAFSIAINVDADIVLIDEILTVGDAYFQEKCFDKLMEIKRSGITIVLVSHSLEQIEKICDKCIWIADGRIREIGTPKETNARYLECVLSNRKEAGDSKTDKHRISEGEKKALIVKKALLKNSENIEQAVFWVGNEIRLEIELETLEPIWDFIVEINLVRADGLFCYGASTRTDDLVMKRRDRNFRIQLNFSEMNLLNGVYHFDLNVTDGNGVGILFVGNIRSFEMKSQKDERGMLFLRHAWIEE